MSGAAEIVSWSAFETAARVREGEVSAAEILSAYRARIDAQDPTLGIYLREARARGDEEAAAVDAARSRGDTLGPLAGVPMGLKDNFVTRGVETTCGSKILGGWIPPYEGTHASRLAEAGALLLGKHGMDEFAMGSSNENTPFRVPRNPWDPECVAGGSSGASAAAVAAGLAAFAIGSDTGGSIRQPASLCGVVGLKPTYGRVTRAGMIAFASSLDQAGPIAREVRDAALVLGVLAGADPLDASCSERAVPDFVAACERGVAGLRIGVPRAALGEGVDDEVRAAFEAALEVMQSAGAQCVDIELPHADASIPTYYVLAMAEASSNLARYDGVRYGLRAPAEDLRRMYEATREAGFGEEVKRRVMLGTFVLRKDSFDAYYGRAQRVRTLIARDHDAALKQCDLIATPTSPVAGFRRGERTHDPLAMYLSDIFTVGANLAGLPAISVPCGFARAPRLPIGLQLVGRRWDEETVLAAAAAYEASTSWHRERPEAA